MIYGFAAALFLGMAILFTGIAVEWGIAWAWVFVVLNGLLFALNLMLYGKSEERRD
jgi:hypothetical protein